MLSIAALFVLLVALPLLWLLVSATGALVDAVVVGRLLEPRAWRLLGRSVLVALAVAGGAGLLGIPVAVALARTSLPGRRALLPVTLLTLSIPPFTAAIAWSILWTRGGPVATFLGGEAATRPPLPDLTQAIVTLTSLHWPVVTLLLAHALTRQPAVYEEAARLETGPWHAFAVAARTPGRVALVNALLLVFLLALADYAVPATMGVPLYPVEIASSFQADRDAHRSAALALPLLVIVLPLVLLQRRLLDTDASADRGARTAADLPRLPLGGGHLPAVLAVWLIPVTTALLPLAVLFRESLPPATYAEVLPDALDPLRVTLLTAGAAAAVATALGLGVGLGRVGTPTPGSSVVGRWSLVLLATLPYALPGSLIAIAWIRLLNRPGLPGDLYDSVWVLAVAYVTRFFPFAWHSVTAGIAGIDTQFFEAARLDGASPVTLARTIVLPLARGAVLAALALVFLLATRELDATALLRPPDGDTLGFRIHDLYHYGPSRQVAALALAAALGTALPTVACWRLIGRRATELT